MGHGALGSQSVVKIAAATALAVLLALVAAASVSARPDEDAVLGPLGMEIADIPHPVLGADGLNHLVYEIRIVNQSGLDVTIDRVQPRAGGGAFGAAVDGAALAQILAVNGAPGPVIPGGGSAQLFMDVTYPEDEPAPKRLAHGFNLTATDGVQPEQKINFRGVPTRVSRQDAIEVAPPLRGPGWVVGNGCCAELNAHRGATLSIDGTVHVAERFAIDYVQLNDAGMLFEGAKGDLANYGYFGAKIHSATDGKVVRVQDGLPEQTPGALPSGQTVQTAGGNFLVVKADDDHYAFYAHMQPGSLRFEKGDRVREGQVLGLLGNTGNTDGPHLHFHVMDGPSPLQSNGVPFVHPSFTGEGTVTNIGPIQDGATATIDPDALAGRVRNSMPLNNQVVDFGP